MIMLKIAFRNIFRQKRRSTLTALSMFGGFVLAAFFIGFSEGTYNDIINKFTRSQTGHIQVHRKGYLAHPSLYKTIDLPERAAKILGQMDKVDSWAPRLYSAGLASLGDKNEVKKEINSYLGNKKRQQKKVVTDPSLTKGMTALF